MGKRGDVMRMLRWGFVLPVLLLAAACSVRPEPLNTETIEENIRFDQFIIRNNQAPIAGELDLPEAMARLCVALGCAVPQGGAARALNDAYRHHFLRLDSDPDQGSMLFPGIPDVLDRLEAAGLLLAISSAISHDLIKGAINPNISEKGELLAARISMAVAIVVATWLGLNPPGFAAQTVALAFGLAAASIFPALMMGIFSKRINNKGAIAGMLAGLLFTVIYIFVYKGWFFIPGTNNLPDTAANWVLGISPLSIGAVGAIINFAVAFLVANATEEPPKEIQALVESVRYPKGAGVAIDH